MKVRELIEALQQFDPELPVCVYVEERIEADFEEATSVIQAEDSHYYSADSAIGVAMGNFVFID